MSTKTAGRTSRTDTCWDERQYDEVSVALSKVYNTMLKNKLRSSKANITFRIVPDNPAEPPARYLPTFAECEIQEKYVRHIKPSDIGRPDWISTSVQNARLHGLILHEIFGHHGYSNIDLIALQREYARRHVTTLLLLEEGRCESKAYKILDEISRQSMRVTVMDIILQDMNASDIDRAGGATDDKKKKMILQLLGLVALRSVVGIIDKEQERSRKILEKLEQTIGADLFQRFMDVAVRVGHIDLLYSQSEYDRYHRCVRDWIALEDEYLQNTESDDGGDDGDDGDDGDGKGGDGDGGDDDGGDSDGKGGDSDGKDGDSDSDGGDGDGDGDGKDGDGKDDGDTGDEDDLHKIGENDKGKPNRGEYSSSKQVEDDGESLEDMLQDLRKELGGVADEVDRIASEALSTEHKRLQTAYQEDQVLRRAHKKNAQRAWQNKERDFHA